tara:strand:+ start:31 stop:642 length:612 start_codon:yes stop_codon:yes gene_type:complete
MALMSAAALYPYLPGLDSGADGDLNTIIARSESAIADYLGFAPASVGAPAVLTTTTYTLYLDGPSTEPRMIQLPIKPVASITTIHDDVNWDYGSSELVAASNYTLVGEKGQVWLNPDASHVWSTAPRALKIVFVGGFSGSNPDSALSTAILEYCAVIYERRRGGAGRRSASAGNANANFNLPPIPDPVRQLLRPYRLPVHWLT